MTHKYQILIEYNCLRCNFFPYQFRYVHRNQLYFYQCLRYVTCLCYFTLIRQDLYLCLFIFDQLIHLVLQDKIDNDLWCISQKKKVRKINVNNLLITHKIEVIVYKTFVHWSPYQHRFERISFNIVDSLKIIGLEIYYCWEPLGIFLDFV